MISRIKLELSAWSALESDMGWGLCNRIGGFYPIQP
jgi:hypothetical protein